MAGLKTKLMELVENKFSMSYSRITRFDVKGQLKDQNQGDKSKRACQGSHGGERYPQEGPGRNQCGHRVSSDYLGGDVRGASTHREGGTRNSTQEGGRKASIPRYGGTPDSTQGDRDIRASDHRCGVTKESAQVDGGKTASASHSIPQS